MINQIEYQLLSTEQWYEFLIVELGFQTVMWQGLPGMCSSPHLTTRMYSPLSLSWQLTLYNRLPKCFTRISSQGTLGPSTPTRSMLRPVDGNTEHLHSNIATLMIQSSAHAILYSQKTLYLCIISLCAMGQFQHRNMSDD